jgi:hypothetical protein
MAVGLECSYRAEFWGNFSVWVGFVGEMSWFKQPNLI